MSDRPFNGSEAEWIAHEIVSELHRMPGVDKARAVDESVPKDVRTHLWDPDAYVEVARKVISPSRHASTGSAELLSTLTAPRVAVIQAANVAISSRLRADPLSSAAHEDAALILGVLALREAAGAFSDTRPALCRMTAHLAMARALGGGRTSRNAGAADLIMQVLLGRQQDALNRLEPWLTTERDGAAHSWARTLTMRATGDWRRLEHPERASLLERTAYVRALRERVDEPPVLNFLGESHPERVADWSRILTGAGASVESGQLLAEKAVAEELAEAAQVWPGSSNHRDDEAALVDALNDGPSPGVATSGDGPYRVIDWPTWRGSFQRHIARKIVSAVYTYHYMLKSRDTRAVVTRFDREFGRSPLYPLVRRTYAYERAQYQVAMTDARALIATHPELITAAQWTLLMERWNADPVPEDVREPSTWFGPGVPTGTAYDASHRIFGVKRSLMAQPAVLTALKAIAPYERDPILELARIHLGAKPALDALEREVGKIGEYDREVLYQLAAAAGDDLERYLPIGRRLCAMNADDCDSVAAYLVDHDREPEAATLYRFFAEHARDRVGVSNSIRWLVIYDFDSGRTQEAARLADEAADTNSYGGMVTKAKLLERTGQFDAAEALLQTTTTRYDNATDLTAFYLRRLRTPEGLKQLEAVAKPLVAKIFPEGMDHVLGPPPDDNPPTDGVRVTRAGHRGATAGFAQGDLIVAVDGVWVHNYVQFTLVWRMSPEPEMSFLVFHDGKYREIRGALRDRWLSGSFTGYDWRQPILR